MRKKNIVVFLLRKMGQKSLPAGVRRVRMIKTQEKVEKY